MIWKSKQSGGLSFRPYWKTDLLVLILYATFKFADKQINSTWFNAQPFLLY